MIINTTIIINTIINRPTSPPRTCMFSPPSTRTRLPTSSLSRHQGMMMMMMAMMIMVMRMRSLTRQIGRLLYSDNFKRVGFVCHNYICCFVFALCWCFVLITVSLQSYPLFNGHHPSASLTSPSDPNGQWCCTSTISNQLSLKLSMVKHLIFFLFVFSVQFELLILLSWS